MKKQQPLVSIIVPVYQVEKYLRENEVEVEEDWICKIEQDSCKQM